MTTTPPQDTKMAEAEVPEQKPSLLITDAITLAVVSAGAYLFAFIYERGVASFFGIPTQFMNVSLVTLLIFGASTITFLYVVAYLLEAVLPLLQFKHPYLQFQIPRLLLLLFLLVLIPFILFRGQQWKLFLFSVVCWCLVIILNVVMPLIKHRKKGSWTERYEAQMELEVKQYTPSFFALVGSRYGIRNAGLLAWLLLVATWLTSIAGEAEAMNQERFLVLNSQPEMVVLRIYDDNMICAPFDRNAKEVKKSFSIRKIAEDPKLIMNLERVGPLKPVDKLASESVSPTPTPEIIPTPTPAPVESPTSEGKSERN